MRSASTVFERVDILRDTNIRIVREVPCQSRAADYQKSPSDSSLVEAASELLKKLVNRSQIEFVNVTHGSDYVSR